MLRHCDADIWRTPADNGPCPRPPVLSNTSCTGKPVLEAVLDCDGDCEGVAAAEGVVDAVSDCDAVGLDDWDCDGVAVGVSLAAQVSLIAYSVRPRYGAAGDHDAPPSILSRFPVTLAAPLAGRLPGLELVTLFQVTGVDDVTTTEKEEPRVWKSGAKPLNGRVRYPGARGIATDRTTTVPTRFAGSLVAASAVRSWTKKSARDAFGDEREAARTNCVSE